MVQHQSTGLLPEVSIPMKRLGENPSGSFSLDNWLKTVPEKAACESTITTPRGGASSSSLTDYASLSSNQNEEELDGFNNIFDYNHDHHIHLQENSDMVSPKNTQFPNTLPPGSDTGIDFMTAFIKQEDIDKLPNTESSKIRSQSLPENTVPVKKFTTKRNAKSISVARKPSRGKRAKRPLNPHQRKAHNKIERKYRININSKIATLQRLVPWMCEEDVAFEVAADGQTTKVPHLNAEARKLNKSMILDVVTKYVAHLKAENSIFKEKLRTYEG